MTAYAISAPAASRVGSSRAANAEYVPAAVIRLRRFVLVLVVLALVALIAPRAFAGSDASTEIAFDTYTVAQGESLWSIASSLTGPGADVHDTVNQLQTLNAMGGSSLQAGEQIYIPVLEG